jgi:ParB family chromosome partitioning protein
LTYNTDAREAVGKSLDSIEKSGIKYEHQAKDYDDYYEIKIKLFKHY